MIVRVQKHTSGYSVISNFGLNDVRLSLKARGLLGYFLTKPDDWEISVSGTVAQVSDGPTAVKSALKELHSFGYAECVLLRGDKGQLMGKTWIIHELPVDRVIDNQLVAMVMQSNRQAGFPTVGKTDLRETRLSGKRKQVSTVLEVNTDLKKVRQASRKKKALKTLVANAPPLPAPPPKKVPAAALHLFSESVYVNVDPSRWAELMLFSGLPPNTDTFHYLQRCRTWSFRNGKKSADWLNFAVLIAKSDLSKLELKTISDDTNQPTSGSTRSDVSSDGHSSEQTRRRALARASRLLNRAVK